MKVFGCRSDEGKADFDGMEAVGTRITSRLIFSISRMTVSLRLKTSSPLLSAIPFPSYPTVQSIFQSILFFLFSHCVLFNQ
ncbi:hypothetical protein Dimus_007895 [Dionaea muscipula]